MSKQQHNCSQCEFLRRTSPTQVFLKCEFWSGPLPDGILDAYEYDYIITHCHMQPEAPACAFFQQKREVVA